MVPARWFRPPKDSQGIPLLHRAPRRAGHLLRDGVYHRGQRGHRFGHWRHVCMRRGCRRPCLRHQRGLPVVCERDQAGLDHCLGSHFGFGDLLHGPVHESAHRCSAGHGPQRLLRLHCRRLPRHRHRALPRGPDRHLRRGLDLLRARAARHAPVAGARHSEVHQAGDVRRHRAVPDPHRLDVLRGHRPHRRRHGHADGAGRLHRRPAGPGLAPVSGWREDAQPAHVARHLLRRHPDQPPDDIPSQGRHLVRHHSRVRDLLATDNGRYLLPLHRRGRRQLPLLQASRGFPPHLEDVECAGVEHRRLWRPVRSSTHHVPLCRHSRLYGDSVRHGEVCRLGRPSHAGLRRLDHCIHGRLRRHRHRRRPRHAPRDGLRRVRRRHQRGRQDRADGHGDRRVLPAGRLPGARLRVDPALGHRLRAGPRRLHDGDRRGRDQLALPGRRRAGLRHHRAHALRVLDRRRADRRRRHVRRAQHGRLGRRESLARPRRAPQQAPEGGLDVQAAGRGLSAVDEEAGTRQAGFLEGGGEEWGPGAAGEPREWELARGGENGQDRWTRDGVETMERRPSREMRCSHALHWEIYATRCQISFSFEAYDVLYIL